MFELFKDYPLIVGIIVGVIVFLEKNHILPSNDDVKEIKKQIIKELKEGKIFATPAELTECKDSILNSVKADFLSLAVFNEFKVGIDRQFKNVFYRFDEGSNQFKELNKGINDIKNYLLAEKRK